MYKFFDGHGEEHILEDSEFCNGCQELGGYYPDTTCYLDFDMDGISLNVQLYMDKMAMQAIMEREKQPREVQGQLKEKAKQDLLTHKIPREISCIDCFGKEGVSGTMNKNLTREEVEDKIGWSIGEFLKPLFKFF